MMPCPSCRRLLAPSGELCADGVVMSVYQCDQCTRPWDVGGQVFQVALTFAVDPDGNALDPESGQPLPPGPSTNN